MSYPTITAYSWTFEDGTTSGERSVTRTVSRIGTHTITLTITDSNGDTDTKTFLLPIFPAYTYSSLMWHFGDDEGSSTEDPVHTYKKMGVFEPFIEFQDGSRLYGPSVTVYPSKLNPHRTNRSFTLGFVREKGDF